MTVGENKARLDRLQAAHDKCQQERIELSVMVRQLHARFLAEDSDGWGKHALLIAKAIEDLEAAQERTNSRIWKLVIGVLFALLGVILSLVKSQIGG